MDPITAVGFAVNILTFVDFSWTLIKGAYEVYELGTTANNTRIDTVLSDLGGITKSIQSDIPGNSPHVKDLKSLAAGCVKVSQELSAILKELEMKEGNKVWRSLESKWKSMRKEKEIAAIEQKLIEYRLQLLLRLNLMLSEQQISIKCQLDDIQKSGLQLSIDGMDKLTTLHQAMQSLEGKLTGALIQSPRINDPDNTANTASFSEIKSSLLSLMTQLQAASSWNTAESRILKKLYFNSMYSRSETISEAEAGTFRWLFEDDSKKSGLLEPDRNDSATSRGSNSSTTDENRNIHILAPASGTEESEALDGNVKHKDGAETLSLSGIDVTNSEELSDGGLLGDMQSNDSSHQDSKDNDDLSTGSNDNYLSESSDEGDDSSIEEDSEDPAEEPVRYPEELELQGRTRQSFLKWLNLGNGVYHISGKAGSGKSTLMKSLVQHPRLMEELREWAGDKKIVFGKFFFWNSGDVQQRSLEGLYRSLLFEILNQCPDLIKEVFPTYWNSAQAQIPGWEDIPFLFSELREAMGNIVERHQFSNRRFCFFIDGLDEFEGESTEYWTLAQMLRRWASLDDVKICVSSRPYTEFLEVFDNSLRMQLHDLTRGDIQRFTSTKFENEHCFAVGDETFSTFIKDIVEGADGVFLWVRLVVRSLLDGARHRSSLPVLKEKLYRIPRGLDSLFDKLFNDIDPAERGRSDRMLNLATSYGVVNALLYSWLEDLENPEFPYDAPVQAYSNEEIEKRHTNVRAQLDNLSKGLLEMKVSSRWTSEAGNDVYFRYEVDFFHRSVRDYLKEPVRYASIQQRLGDFDGEEAYERLLLAQYKFARTMSDYFRTQGTKQTALVSCFSSIFDHKSSRREMPPRLLDECGRILDHHRQNPFSHPDETSENSGIIAWGQNWDSRREHGIPHDVNISYPLWLVVYNQTKYLMTQIMVDKGLVAPAGVRSLLLTASISTDYELVCDLLRHKASPGDQIMVKCGENVEETRVTTIWAVFLIIMPQKIRSRYIERNRVVNYFLILEEFLKLGVDNDVCFLFSTKEGTTKTNDDEMVILTLEDFILIHHPPNSDSLIKLALKGKGSLLWNGTMQLLSTLKPWIGGLQRPGLKDRKAQLNDLFTDTQHTPSLESICIRGDWLENNFIVGWF